MRAPRPLGVLLEVTDVKLIKATLGLAVTLGLGQAAQASPSSQLCSAAAGGDYNGVMTAVQLGADPNVRDRVWRTPLGWAARNGHRSVASYLLSHGAQVDVKDAQGDTPLMSAAASSRFELVALLVAHGANPLPRDAQGRDALLLARGSRDWRSAAVLERYLHGEAIGARPQPRRTAPSMAVAVSKPPAATPKPAPVAVAPTAAPVPTAVAPAAPTEPNLMVKAIALKKLAEASLRASTTLDTFVKANASNPMALMDPDVLLGKDLVTMYADVAKTQSLVGCRQALAKVQASWNNRTASRFTQNITDVDAILKEAGL